MKKIVISALALLVPFAQPMFASQANESKRLELRPSADEYKNQVARVQDLLARQDYKKARTVYDDLLLACYKDMAIEQNAKRFSAIGKKIDPDATDLSAVMLALGNRIPQETVDDSFEEDYRVEYSQPDEATQTNNPITISVPNRFDDLDDAGGDKGAVLAALLEKTTSDS